MEKWEYDFTSHTEEMKSPYHVDNKTIVVIQEAMNERGEQGWELVAVSPIIFAGTCASFKCFWKRHKE